MYLDFSPARKDSFIYPVVIETADDGVSLYFPDLPGTAVMAADTVTGIKNAKEMMIDRIIEMEDKGLPIPDPSNPEDIELHSPTDRIVYLDVYLPPYRDEATNKSVTKNCTLPKWLRDASEEAGLKDALGIKQGERP
ncbi:type II toxin-antitoxin system HicB family antitoxin [Paenibacillus sp. FJAT-26967]|uniref:type II toxin-antitoxin system HicB family antitoxin n=1 Tax=Paenibacillus sp. FJAT-26967 TaxID=1729690 RepID=UPI00083855A5|nr:type II toxin-antitoxin system HicB family antitoxin [Paenibacillus sp. FJAT-26967]